MKSARRQQAHMADERYVIVDTRPAKKRSRFDEVSCLPMLGKKELPPEARVLVNLLRRRPECAAKPVIFPSGRARFETIPTLTGSPMAPITTGIVVVACFAAKAAGVTPCHDEIDRKHS